MFCESAYTPSFNGYRSSDMHAWIELPNNKIMDYPITTLKSSSCMGTDYLRYVPFEEKHQQILYERYTEKLAVKYNEFACMGKNKDEADKHFMITSGYCFYRAIVIHKRLLEKNKSAKVVFGSLGFLQPNGRVFYEFG